MKQIQSYAIGYPIKLSPQRNNNFDVFIGKDEDYKCELTEGDEIFMISHDGFRHETMYERYDKEENVLYYEGGNVNLNVLCFLGRM